MAFTAKDVQALRQLTGVGMLDAKNALQETDGDMDEAQKLLRVKGLASAAKRTDREAAQGAVSVVKDGNCAAIVEVRCETDFVAKSDEFVKIVDEMAAAVARDGEGAIESFAETIETLLTTLKENISVGKVVRLCAGEDEIVDTYLHIQHGRGVNAVAVVARGVSQELAHEVALNCSFMKPLYLTRDEVPSEEVESERKTIEEISRNEGKPEAALPKIIDGRLNAWFKDRVLLEQTYQKDDKQNIQQLIGSGAITAFAQVEIGA